MQTSSSYGLSSSSSARERISSAAFVENVSASTFSGGMPCSASQAMRRVITRVLPLPAPASTSSGPPGCVTASRCASFKPSSNRSAIGTDGNPGSP